MRVQLILGCWLLMFNSTAVASEACLLLQEQLDYLLESEKETLRLAGFVYSTKIAGNLPEVVISQEIINQCEHRLLAEKYFVNKIRGESVFDLNIYELEQARPAIAEAAYLAVNVKGVWPDGVSHEIFNVVSDDLLPDWIMFQIRSVEEFGVDLTYFTPSTFAYPHGSLQAVVESVDRKSLRNYEVALLLFLKKNMGLEVSIEAARSELENAETSKDLVSHVSDEEIIDTAIELLRKEGRISYDEANEFLALLFGWV